MRVLRLLSRLWWALSCVGAFVFGWSAFLLSHLERRDMVLTDEAGFGGPERLGPHVVLFAHWDGQGRIRDHTRAYIDALRAEGLDLVFVTNAGRLAPPDLAWIRGRAARILIRRNVGYDFAAWRDAIRAAGLPSLETRFLLITNDSVYGPLHPLRPILDRIDFEHADVWGATDSWQHRFHLQSFFVAFGPKALASEAFPRFWRSVANVRSKWSVVTRYELGLSRSLMAAGLRCKALWPYVGMIEALRAAAARERTWSETEEVTDLVLARKRERAPSLEDPIVAATRRNAERILAIASRRIPLNPTADLWQVLIEQGCPFIKRELLRENPSQVPGVAAWSLTIDRNTGFDRDVIMRDLERSLKNCSP